MSRAQPTGLWSRQRWAVSMAVSVGLGVMQAVPEILDAEATASVLLRFLHWVVLVPLEVAALSFVFERGVERGTGPARIAVACVLAACAIGAAFGLAFVVVFEGVLHVPLDEKGPLPPFVAAGFGGISGVPIAGLWALTFVSPHLTAQAQRRDLETEQLRLEAEQLRVAAELARLRAQLEPHFLLNTLHTIAGLVTQDPHEARRLLGCLGDLLRDSLHERGETQTLDEEVSWLRRYTGILESRHGSALTFEWDIPADAGAVRLPSLLLQPLVENAVQHGALRRPGGGRVEVGAAVRRLGGGPVLVCTVRDNGPGVHMSEPREGGVGLWAVRRRLELRCPGATVRLESSTEGTAAIVEIPLEFA